MMAARRRRTAYLVSTTFERRFVHNTFYHQLDLLVINTWKMKIYAYENSINLLERNIRNGILP